MPAIKPNVVNYLDRVFRPTQSEESFTMVKGKLSLDDLPDLAPTDKFAANQQAKKVDSQLRGEFSSCYNNFKNGNDIQKEKAKEAFKRLSNIKEGIVPAHKHMFTDFGVDLRKIYLNELAMCHFRRATELSPNDSHTQFNLARILYELNRYDKAREHAETALRLEPDLGVAEKLIKSIDRIQGFDKRPDGTKNRLSF